ncbi:DUF2058 domain-containing protein [Methylosoma difficile]
MSKPKLSLQEQLLKSGLVSAAKAKSVKTEKSKQAKQQRHNNLQVVDEAKELALKAQAEKVERDRLLNQQRQQKEEQKTKAAQIKQLIEQNRLPQDADGVAYRFNDNNKIKTLYVSEDMRTAIIGGKYAVVRFAQFYDVVAADVADKIALRDAGWVVVDNRTSAAQTAVEDDPYAAYQIPDDLIW